VALNTTHSHLGIIEFDSAPSTSGRRLLLKMLNRFFGISKLPEITTTPLGKPFFRSNLLPSFNISHSKTHVAVYLGNKEAVGCDIERIAFRPGWQNLAKTYFSKKEAEQLLAQNPDYDLRLFWKYWTAREAWLKQQGKSVWDMTLFALDISSPQLKIIDTSEQLLPLTFQQQQLCLCNTQPFTQMKSCQTFDRGIMISYEHSTDS